MWLKVYKDINAGVGKLSRAKRWKEFLFHYCSCLRVELQFPLLSTRWKVPNLKRTQDITLKTVFYYNLCKWQMSPHLIRWMIHADVRISAERHASVLHSLGFCVKFWQDSTHQPQHRAEDVCNWTDHNIKTSKDEQMKRLPHRHFWCQIITFCIWYRKNMKLEAE